MFTGTYRAAPGVAVDELGRSGEDERGLVAAGVAFAALNSSVSRCARSFRVRSRKPTGFLRLERVDRAVQRLTCSGSKWLFTIRTCRKALARERRADVDDDRLERLLAHVDRAGEAAA